MSLDPTARHVYCTGFPNTLLLVEDIRVLTLLTCAPDAPSLSLEDVDRLVPDHDVLCGGSLASPSAVGVPGRSATAPAGRCSSMS